MKIKAVALAILWITSYAHTSDQAIKPTIVHLKDHHEHINEAAKLWWLGQSNNQKKFSTEQVEPMAAYLKTHATDNTQKHCLIALLNDIVIGIIQLVDIWTDDPEIAPKIASHTNEWRPWVRGAVVHPEYRKQGTLSVLLTAVEKKARELGLSKIYLGTTPELESCYRKHGYKQFDQDKFRGDEIILMCKSVQE